MMLSGPLGLTPERLPTMTETCMTYEDIIYAETGPVARITINREKVYNAFRAETCEEIIHALQRAGWNKDIGVIVLTGAGTRAFCTGGDQSAHDGGYDGRGTVGLPVEALHAIIRVCLLYTSDAADERSRGDLGGRRII